MINKKITLIALAIFLIASYFSITGKLNYEIGQELNKVKKAGQITELSQLAKKEKVYNNNRAQLYLAASEIVDFDFYRRPGSEKKMPIYYKENKEKLISSFQKNQMVFDIMDKSMTLDKCNFNLDYEKGFGTPPPIPNFLNMRKVNYLLSFKAFNDIEEGRYSDALIKINQCLNIGKSFLDENSSLLSQMMAAIFINIGMEPLFYMVENHIEADYRPVINTLSSIKNSCNENFIKSLQVERTRGMDGFKKLTNNTLSSVELEVFEITLIKVNKYESNSFIMTFLNILNIKEDIQINLTKYLNKYTISFLKPWILADELYYVKSINKMIDILQKNPEGEVKQEEPAGYYLISSNLIPNIERAYSIVMNIKKDCKKLIGELEK
ncbi:MAG TPA: hypothetical protein PL110_04055 [Candidatus Eremiobacteraeota bacterium]|nr:MAG: hypothetical protein BWY64_00585 [bacterium ADurb.Bin363]HPZ07261.1 hypothetical protein [Candidatus Eremiobacteraeota bacterium]